MRSSQRQLKLFKTELKFTDRNSLPGWSPVPVHYQVQQLSSQLLLTYIMRRHVDSGKRYHILHLLYIMGGKITLVP